MRGRNLNYAVMCRLNTIYNIDGGSVSMFLERLLVVPARAEKSTFVLIGVPLLVSELSKYTTIMAMTVVHSCPLNGSNCAVLSLDD